MPQTVSITLPTGLWLDSTRCREVDLRPLNGADEDYLLEVGPALSPASRTTALLARCVTHLGSLAAATPSMIRSLTIGDREALLLHLRRLTLGEQMNVVLDCPHPDCAEKMEMPLHTGELLLPPYEHTALWHEAEISENGTLYPVRFRLPTGADQEAAADLARRDPEAAAALILRRCLEQEDARFGEDLPAVLAEQLSAIMADLDPQAELVLNLTCPVCGQPFSTLLDTATFFFQELNARMKYLYLEVHELALYYHWTEQDIMSMTPRKRRLYLEALTEALSEAKHA